MFEWIHFLRFQEAPAQLLPTEEPKPDHDDPELEENRARICGPVLGGGGAEPVLGPSHQRPGPLLSAVSVVPLPLSLTSSRRRTQSS